MRGIIVAGAIANPRKRIRSRSIDRVVVDQGRENPRRGILIGIAAAAVVVVGALILFQPRDSVPPATATEVAAAFVEAYADYDVDTAVSYVAAGADVSELGGSVAGMRLAARWDEAAGFKVLLDSCEERSTSSTGTWVRGTFDFHATRSPFGNSAAANTWSTSGTQADATDKVGAF